MTTLIKLPFQFKSATLIAHKMEALKIERELDNRARKWIITGCIAAGLPVEDRPLKTDPY